MTLNSDYLDAAAEEAKGLLRNAIRRLVYGPRVVECRCGKQWRVGHWRNPLAEYEAHWATEHSATVQGKTPQVMSTPAGGRVYAEMTPLPFVVRAKKRADW